jgi:hypothetical protein
MVCRWEAFQTNGLVDWWRELEGEVVVMLFLQELKIEGTICANFGRRWMSQSHGVPIADNARARGLVGG